MKKLLLTSLVALVMFTATTAPSHAFTVVCVNCSDNIQQTVQLAKEAFSAITNNITAVQQTLDTVNNRILIPMRDALTVATLMKSSTNVQNMVAGALGTSPLLIQNPDQYFRMKAQQSVQSSIGNLYSVPGIYNKSILSALISSNRNTYADTQTKLTAAAQSDLPSIIQKNVCDDAMLTRLATQDVQAGSSDGTVDPNAVVDRKRELNRALCSGDPSTNPGLASTLTTLYQQHPEVGGWDAWLAMTGGDNPYNQATRVQQVIDQQAQTVTDQAKNDYNLGGGIRSLTDCNSRASTTIYGTSYGQEGGASDNMVQAPCISETIRQTGSAIKDAYNKALSLPDQLRLASFGKGAGSLVSTVFTSISLLQGIQGGMNNLSGGGNGGPVGWQGAQYSNNGVITNSTSAAAQDLVNNPEAKSTLTNPPKQQLTMHLSSLSDLQATDANYLSEIAYYQGKLDSMQSCYNSLITSHPEVQSDQRAVTALNFYNTTTASNSSLTSTLNQEVTNIATTTALINTTLNIINTSNSSEEIANAFNFYQNQIDSYHLPDLTASASRTGDYMTFKSNVDQSIAEGGALYQYQNNCTVIQQSYLQQNTSNGM